MAKAPELTHLLRLLDDTGILQHATYSVPAREHGYCLDDNARGLMLAAGLRKMHLRTREADALFARTAAFVQHAWNGEAGRFRNFMGFDRSWLEQVGSEDSHGRAVWALGVAARDMPEADARLWAREWLGRALPSVLGFTSPRALACALLGLCAADTAPDVRDRLADRLCCHLADNRKPDWVWFEDSLHYDNARLCEALMAAGLDAGRRDWIGAGLDTLGWLCRVQRSEAGRFSSIGSDGFWFRGRARARFDQQPIEAAGTVSAALLAWRVTGDPAWFDEAGRAHGWFTGDNDLGLSLVVPETGGCCDGLHRDRVNANQGAESTLAWLQADLDWAGAQDLQVRLPPRPQLELGQHHAAG